MPKINFHVILKFIGILLCMESIFMRVPFVVALIYGEGDAPAFIKSASITAIVGGILFYIFRNSRNDVGKRESYLLVTSIWLFFSAFGMLPFCLMPNHLSITDAIFETVSGLTTTGASIIENVDVLPHGILFWRSFMHFIGGMGIILLTIAILPMLNHQGGLLLFKSEVTGITTENAIHRTHANESKSFAKLFLLFVFEIIFYSSCLCGYFRWFDYILAEFQQASPKTDRRPIFRTNSTILQKYLITNRFYNVKIKF